MSFAHPIVGCGQRVIEATERNDPVQLSDGYQLLAVAVLKAQRALDVFVKQRV